MKIRKQQTGLLLVVLIVIALVSGTFAQETSRAQKAYDAWQTKNQEPQDERAILIAVSAIKYENIGATIDVVVGVGPGITKLGNLEFIVKPVAVVKGDNGEAVFQELSGGGMIKAYQADESVETEVEREKNGVIATPRLTIPMPANAGAIKITVRETSSGKNYNITLPFKETGSSAVLAGVINESNLFTKCQWTTITCETSCGTMCLGCNGLADGNCANCTVTCQSGAPCTPSGPKPPRCS